jgi:DNA-binding transcriptional LysR family regulator
MDLVFLESLLHVVDQGSIAQAARLQHLTPAAVRQRVNALERELGVQLITRAGHRCAPTLACNGLLPRARMLVREGTLLREDTEATGLAGALRIGAISTALTGMMPNALRALAKDAPRLVPQLKPGTSAALYDAVLAGELDAAVIVAPPFATPKTLLTTTLRREPLRLISSAASDQTIKQQLARGAYIRYDAQAWGGRFAQQYILDQRIDAHVLCELDALEAITMMVAEGLGVSLIPEWSGLRALSHNLHITPISTVKYQREIVLLTRRQGASTEKMRFLSKLLTPKARLGTTGNTGGVTRTKRTSAR